MPEPTHRYPLSSATRDELDVRRSGVRRITHAGRSGWVLDSTQGCIRLGAHGLDARRGTVTCWAMPVEDLMTWAQTEKQNLNNPHARHVVLLSDREAVGDQKAANFSLAWDSNWHPGFTAKWFHGDIYEGFIGAPKAAATAGHLPFRAGHWYHIACSWDHDAGTYRVYVNGVLVAHHSEFPRPGEVTFDSPGPFLFTGSPMWCMGDVEIFDSAFDANDAEARFRAEATKADEQVQGELRRVYHGEGLEPLAFDPAPPWSPRLHMALDDPEDLAEFYVQGGLDAPSITDEGLRIRTPNRPPAHNFGIPDHDAVYLWTQRRFEGDLYVRFDWRNDLPGGLALLMLQASGMHGESPLTDHRLRTAGNMESVAWQDIRNYHWEFLREMNDVRNDVASHALLKNPWRRPLAFGVAGPLYEPHVWHSLEFLQEGGRLRGAIDGTVVISATDDPGTSAGPVLSRGHLVIRAMARTDIVVRDLEVWTRSKFDQVESDLQRTEK